MMGTLLFDLILWFWTVLIASGTTVCIVKADNFTDDRKGVLGIFGTMIAVCLFVASLWVLGVILVGGK